MEDEVIKVDDYTLTGNFFRDYGNFFRDYMDYLRNSGTYRDKHQYLNTCNEIPLSEEKKKPKHIINLKFDFINSEC